jgi:hypothetical protein
MRADTLPSTGASTRARARLREASADCASAAASWLRRAFSCAWASSSAFLAKKSLLASVS